MKTETSIFRAETSVGLGEQGWIPWGMRADEVLGVPGDRSAQRCGSGGLLGHTAPGGGRAEHPWDVRCPVCASTHCRWHLRRLKMISIRKQGRFGTQDPLS